jgi:2-amino-4-hydroxy-6-hydroxymethyldihydropteridine diphosphokinase
MSTAYIALGANLPFESRPPQATLARALAALAAADLTPAKTSSLWRSPAWPPSAQADYYNAVAALDTRGHSPQALYQLLVAVETAFGRERRQLWAARTLDLDIVAVEGLCGRFDGIELPHPRMHERAFVLAPLAEIAPHWRHPVLGRSVQTLLEALPQPALERLGPFP